MHDQDPSPQASWGRIPPRILMDLFKQLQASNQEIVYKWIALRRRTENYGIEEGVRLIERIDDSGSPTCPRRLYLHNTAGADIFKIRKVVSITARRLIRMICC